MQITGQRNEAGFGLMDYNARYYDPYLNRFLSPDPIIQDPYNPLDWDRYQYVRSNPVNFNDPTGYDVDCTSGEAGCKKQVADEQMNHDLLFNGVTGSKNVTTHVGDPNTFHNDPNDPYPNRNEYKTNEEHHEALKGWIQRNGVHPGVDISGSEGDNLIAAHDGKVVYVGEPLNGSAPGYVVVIEHVIKSHIYYAVYFHVSTNEDYGTPPQVGANVKTGDVIGPMGKSGTPGVHLHFEVRRDFPPNWSNKNSYWPHSREAFDKAWLDIAPAFGGSGWGWGYLQN